MKNTLIVLNYQREIPPFMQTILHYANQIFKRIIYITPEMYNDNRSACDADKLEVVQLPRSMWRKALLKSPVTLANKETFQMLSLGKKHKKLDGGFFKNLLQYAVCSEMLKEGFFKVARETNIDLHDCVILCTWFDVCAYAASHIKKKYPQIPIVSFAHSFEITEEVKNPYALYSYNQSKHEVCNKIWFISETVRRDYLQRLNNIYHRKISVVNTRIVYLGSKKEQRSNMSTPSSDNIIRLVSCSNVTWVKRVHKIVDAVSAVTDVALEWTHLGGGPLLEQVQEQANNELKGKLNISFHFPGVKSNKEVHDYFSSQCVDLFVNLSESEGLPVSIMESMSYGIPVIATDVGGTCEIVNEKTGFLIPKDFQPQKVAEIITNFSLLSKEEKQKYREAAYEMWESKFDGEKNSLKMLSELHSM